MDQKAPMSGEKAAERHNELFARANELLKGSLILDGVSHNRPGFFARRRLRKAAGLFQQVLEISPAHWQSMFFIGKAFQSLEEHQQSLHWFMRAHECAPDNPSIFKESVWAASRLGKYDLSFKAMQQAVEKHPADPALQCNFGLTCLLAGRPDEACVAFGQATQLEPKNEVNKKLLRYSQEIKSGKRPNPKNEREIIKTVESF